MKVNKDDICGELIRDTHVYKVIDNKFLNNLTLSKTILNPLQQTGGHKHEGLEEVYFFIRGFGRMELDDEVTVLFEMGTQFSREGKEYAFAIAMPGHYMLNGFTVTHSNSMVAGQLSYLRVLQTAGEAILDFCAQYAPDAIDVTGYDSQAGKDLQKTRIYRGLLHANAAKLATAGYRILDRSGKLYLVAQSRYDATGIA